MGNKKQETPKDKIEKLANEFEGNPETEDLAIVLFVIAGSAMLGKEATKSLALWNATWADSVINEVNKVREEDEAEEDVTEKLTKKIIDPNNE